MSENHLILKILFQERGLDQTEWIVGTVSKQQFYSPKESLIEVRNYQYSKTIGKVDIIQIKPLKEREELIIEKPSLTIIRPLLMES